MAGGKERETEIKIRVTTSAGLILKLESGGFRLLHPRVFETNVIYDTEDLALRGRGELLRLRTVEGRMALITYKGRASVDTYKSREELEVSVSDGPMMERILDRLGYRPRFRYEKYRTEYADEAGIVTFDETPIGDFLELEGDPAWIDRTATLLGFQSSDYVTDSYATLYRKFCDERQLPLADMTFPLNSAQNRP